jgi:anti-sigma factor RsiW
MMMHISDDVLQAYLDGELADGEGRTVAAHITDCGACGARLRSLERLYSLVESLPERPLDADLMPGVMARLAPRPALSRRARWMLLVELGLGVGSLAGALSLLNWTPPAWMAELSSSLADWPSTNDMLSWWSSLQPAIQTSLDAAQAMLAGASGTLASALSAAGWATVLGTLVLAGLVLNGWILTRTARPARGNGRSA